MARSRTTALTRADQKKLAHLASRPDLPKIMSQRLRYLEWLDTHFEFLMERLESLLVTATKDTEPQARLIMSVMDRFAPSLRENTQGPEAAAATGGKSVSIKVYNVNRGTAAARRAAIEIEATKRAVYEVSDGGGNRA